MTDTWAADQIVVLEAERDRVTAMQDREERDWALSVLKGRLQQIDQDIRGLRAMT